MIYFPCLFGFFCFSATLISHFKKNKNSIKKEAIFVGCGISSATLAHQLAQKGYQIIIYEKNSFIGGNCYDY
ncbi:NAD(P)-binding protein [bacterium]|nr:NAD(P)-binding protein [bacterium]